MTINHFRQLQELELSINWKSWAYESLLSSITTELRRIVFSITSATDWSIFSQTVEAWDFLDKQFCELVVRLGRMGYHHTLEVEFRVVREFLPPVWEWNSTKFLPEFRKKGFVAFVDSGPRWHAVSTRCPL